MNLKMTHFNSGPFGFSLPQIGVITLILIASGVATGVEPGEALCRKSLVPKVSLKNGESIVRDFRVSKITADESLASIQEDLDNIDSVRRFAFAEMQSFLNETPTVFDSVSVRKVVHGEIHYLSFEAAQKLKGRTVAFISYLEPNMYKHEGIRVVVGKVVDVIKNYMGSEPDGQGGQIPIYEPRLVLEGRKPELRPWIWLNKLESPVYFLD